jgi:hypothetical protein
MTKRDTLALTIGTHIWCTVHAVRGWYRVTAIRSRDGYIKLDSGYNVWCPPHNFRLTDDNDQPWKQL